MCFVGIFCKETKIKSVNGRSNRRIEFVQPLFKVKYALKCLKCTIRTCLSDIRESMRTFSDKFDVWNGLQTSFNWFLRTLSGEIWKFQN